MQRSREESVGDVRGVRMVTRMSLKDDPGGAAVQNGAFRLAIAFGPFRANRADRALRDTPLSRRSPIKLVFVCVEIFQV